MVDSLNVQKYVACEVGVRPCSSVYDPFQVTDEVKNGTTKDVYIYAKADDFRVE